VSERSHHCRCRRDILRSRGAIYCGIFTEKTSYFYNHAKARPWTCPDLGRRLARRVCITAEPPRRSPSAWPGARRSRVRLSSSKLEATCWATRPRPRLTSKRDFGGGRACELALNCRNNQIDTGATRHLLQVCHQPQLYRHPCYRD